eukprot:SAG25_NODE_712_length_5801_cov_2.116626_9_plen_74_part_00
MVQYPTGGVHPLYWARGICTVAVAGMVPSAAGQHWQGSALAASCQAAAAAAGNSGRRTYEDQRKIADMSEFDQ